MTESSTKRPMGVLLAGGASKRLGRDKAMVRMPKGGPGSGRTLLGWGINRLSPLVEGVLVSARGRFQEDCEQLGARSIADGPGSGPAAGILGAAQAVPRQDLLVLACDLPWVRPKLLSELLEAPSQYDWIVARSDGGLEPLCALYRPAAVIALEQRVAEGQYALHPLRELVPTLEVHAPREWFFNLNTQEDLRELSESHCPRD